MSGLYPAHSCCCAIISWHCPTHHTPHSVIRSRAGPLSCLAVAHNLCALLHVILQVKAQGASEGLLQPRRHAASQPLVVVQVQLLKGCHACPGLWDCAAAAANSRKHSRTAGTGRVRLSHFRVLGSGFSLAGPLLCRACSAVVAHTGVWLYKCWPYNFRQVRNRVQLTAGWALLQHMCGSFNPRIVHVRRMRLRARTVFKSRESQCQTVGPTLLTPTHT